MWRFWPDARLTCADDADAAVNSRARTSVAKPAKMAFESLFLWHD
jgi:hypothetical protein